MWLRPAAVRLGSFAAELHLDHPSSEEAMFAIVAVPGAGLARSQRPLPRSPYRTPPSSRQICRWATSLRHIGLQQMPLRYFVRKRGRGSASRGFASAAPISDEGRAGAFLSPIDKSPPSVRLQVGRMDRPHLRDASHGFSSQWHSKNRSCTRRGRAGRRGAGQAKATPRHA